MALKDVIDKLSSYNLFNYLFPGCVFIIILDKTTDLLPYSFEFSLRDVILIYFIGLIVSRIGSLIIEGALNFFLDIGKIDMQELLEKLIKNIKFEIIFEAMNMYRTLAANLILLSLLTIIDLILHCFNCVISILVAFSEMSLSVLFTIAYCKQRRKVLQFFPGYKQIEKSLFGRRQNKKGEG